MDSKQRNYDLRKLLEPYANKWVALSRDRKKVVASGANLREVVSKSQSRDVVLMRAFPADARYAPTGI
ncbi:MAG: hypothetical protein A3D64_02875 [Candidatus Wildermuthbacteria bacterium RIFCSPHIGHO2_02_FULL_49_9]|uniref:DUF5678 domain-containing protein n=2 Tax=Candidatus Wildermuthiibacteriota TaxID=1817923 RepID=A0A1G2QWL1_9BACT|nr:MAG: hypothetical protein A2672_00390 [Candidatus Wildermuthbacteria bacterium RIFCSPHIGHO2_01_FULL_49_22b]OHA71186.1 MAG: hypothetical protein A3D64_02875 [Candidatus Wildermuthbacteria bacterium RIFCSPHIGHO2_02_FULL_49_9]